MSDDVFQLEPTSGPVKVPVPQRNRSRPGRGRAATTTAHRGRAGRFLGWLLAPRWFYGATLAVTALVIHALHNPDWGVASRTWPHEALGFGGTFAWNFGTARLLALIVLALALLVALFLRAGAGRGRLAALGAVFVLAAFPEGSSLLLLAGLAMTGGALLGARRGALLALGLGLLAAHLFLPWSSERFTHGIDLAPAWQANAFDTIDAVVAPKPDVLADRGRAGIVLDHLDGIVALLLAGVGLLALVGAGGRWARWIAALLLLVLFAGTLGRLYAAGADGATDALQAGAGHIARTWFGLTAAYVLCLGAAVAEIAAATTSGRTRP